MSPHPITAYQTFTFWTAIRRPYVPGPEYQATETASVPFLLEVIPTRSFMGSLGILASRTPLAIYRVLLTEQVAYHVSVQHVVCPT